MSTRSEPATLVDVDTGSAFRRHETDDAVITTEVIPHPLRQLSDAAFVSLKEVEVGVNDEGWEEVLGLRLTIPGGCELDVDPAELERALEDIEDCDTDWEDAITKRPDLFGLRPRDDQDARFDLLVPCVLNDVDLPVASVLVSLRSLRENFQRIEIGDGRSAKVTDKEKRPPSTCRHDISKGGERGCRGCLRRMWMVRHAAREERDEQ